MKSMSCSIMQQTCSRVLCSGAGIASPMVFRSVRFTPAPTSSKKDNLGVHHHGAAEFQELSSDRQKGCLTSFMVATMADFVRNSIAPHPPFCPDFAFLVERYGLWRGKTMRPTGVSPAWLGGTIIRFSRTGHRAGKFMCDLKCAKQAFAIKQRVGRQASNVFAVDATHAPHDGSKNSGNHVKQRGFPRAVWADQPCDWCPFQFPKTCIVLRRKSRRKRLCEVFNFYHGYTPMHSCFSVLYM